MGVIFIFFFVLEYFNIFRAMEKFKEEFKSFLFLLIN
jgi:hypothetical protein